MIGIAGLAGGGTTITALDIDIGGRAVGFDGLADRTVLRHIDRLAVNGYTRL